MDINRYLERILYFGELNASLEVLTKLQRAHLLAVPFENLDIYNKIKINLSNSYDKIVKWNRGGFCYELNYAFYQLLKKIGFKVKMVSARVYEKINGFGPEFDHMAIIADIDTTGYLVDVGFGEFAFQPLKIFFNGDQNDPRGIFRIDIYDETHFAVKKKNLDGEFAVEYIFTVIERKLEDFYDMCNYHQTSQESHFTQNRLCTLATNEGRMTLKGNTFKVTINKIDTEIQVRNEIEVRQILTKYFNMSIVTAC